MIVSYIFVSLMSVFLTVFVMSFLYKNKGNKVVNEAIVMSSEFYEGLSYFKLERSKVFAIKKDGSSEIIHESLHACDAEKYLVKVQSGYELWLRKKDHGDGSKINDDDVKVKF